MENQKILYKTIRSLLTELKIFQRNSIFCEGITFIQFNILDILADYGGRRELKQLHEDLQVEKSTTTRLIKPLVHEKLVVREADSEDLRNFYLIITTKGREVHKKYWGCLHKNLTFIVNLIPETDRESVFKALKIIVSAVSACCGGKQGCCR